MHLVFSPAAATIALRALALLAAATAARGDACVLDRFPSQDAALRAVLAAAGRAPPPGVACACFVEGVACAPDAGVVALQLASAGLSTLPPIIAGLAALRSLDLTGNALEALPAELASLGALRSLYLTSNSLRDWPAPLAALTQLADLYLAGNALSAVAPSVANLSSLTLLALDGNRLTALPPELGALTRLSSLFLSDNALSSLPAELGQLTALETLSANGNALTALPDSLTGLARLQQLTLRSNRLTALPAAFGAAPLPMLQTLLLSGNLLSALPASLSGLSALVTLDLADNAFSALPADIALLANLSELGVSGNRLSALPDAFAQLSLPTLDVSGNALTLLNMSWLSPATVRLNASANRIADIVGSCDCGSLFAIDLANNPLSARDGCQALVALTVAMRQPAALLASARLAGCGLASFYGACPDSLQLLSLDLSNNSLERVSVAALAQVLQDQPFAVALLQDNPALRVAPEDLRLLSASAAAPPRYFPVEQMLCDEAQLGDSAARLSLTPLQRHYAGCLCRALQDAPTAWSPAERACVSVQHLPTASFAFSSRVVENATLLAVARGFYPAAGAPGNLSSLRIAQCHDTLACNPRDLSVPAAFECAEGRDPASMLCSRCLAGRFAVGPVCLRCVRGAAALVALSALLVAAAVFALTWRLSGEEGSAAPSSSGVPILLFFLQLNDALEQTLPLSSASPSALAALALALPSQLLALLYLEPFALECLAPHAQAAAPLWLWAALAFGCVPAACAAAALWRGDARAQALATARALYALILLPATRAALAAFNREQQGADTPAYVSAAPFVAWGSAEHREMMALAGVLLAAFVLPYAALSVVRARRALALLQGGGSLDEAARVEPAVRQVRSWPSLWWWGPAVVDGRRIVVAALVELLPWRSEWIAVSVLLLLLALYSATLLARPYARSQDNALEARLLLCSTLLYCGQVAGNVRAEPGALLAAVALAALAAKCAALALLVRRVAPHLLRRLRRKDAEAREWARALDEGGESVQGLLGAAT